LDPWGTGTDFEKIFTDSLALMLGDDNAAIGVISQDLRDGYYLSEGCIQALEDGKRRTCKPVAFITNFSGVRRENLTKLISQIPAPVLTGTQPALRAIHSFLSFRDFAYTGFDTSTLDLSETSKNLLKTHSVLSEFQSMALLKETGFPVADGFIVNNLDELKARKADYGFPLVLKTAAKGILHKSDSGGIVTGISDLPSLEEAFQLMTKKLGSPCLVAPMVEFDVEMIFGMKNDPVFGPIVIIGAGGVFTELLNDKIVIVPWATEKEIAEKLKTLRMYKLLQGFRTTKKANINKLVKIIKSFCESVIVIGEYAKEIDVNPVSINGDIIKALDALIVCKQIDGK
jgi:acyl-CoA synthetase (NDP forming)